MARGASSRKRRKAPRFEEVAITADFRWPPYSEDWVPQRNPWAPWSLGAGLLALLAQAALLRNAYSFAPLVEDGADPGQYAPPRVGPLWLDGMFLSSWAEGATLLVIVFAVAAGVRSLALIVRGADRGLGVTVSGFLLCSVTLMIGQAVLASAIGVAASLVIYPVYAGDRRRAGALTADSGIPREPYSAANPTWAPPRERMPARAIAMRAFLVALVGPTVSLGFFAPPSIGSALWLPAMAGAVIAVPLSVVALVYAIVALRRTFATGEPGRGWAISAIIACSMWFAEIAWFLISLYRFLDSQFT